MRDSLDRAYAALSDPTRRAILTRLAQGEATVSEIAAPFAMSQPAISKHLKVLEQAGLVESARDGRQRPRRLDFKGVVAARRFIDEMITYWPDRFDRLEAFLADSVSTEKEPGR